MSNFNRDRYQKYLEEVARDQAASYRYGGLVTETTNKKESNLIMERETLGGIIITFMVLFFLAALTTLGLWGCPTYNVYANSMSGKAALAHANFSKEVAVAEARAKKESASLLAEAEVARAKGVAAANEIIGDSLKGNDAYLRYLWITEVAGKDIDKTVVYIPTEANVPLLEAGRVVPRQ